jgi:hypothetical protein
MSKKMGRPTVISEEKIEKILDCIRKGAYIETAAAFAGVHKSTFYDWLKKGARKQGKIYEHFSDAVQQAMGESQMFDLNVIHDCAAKGNWQAAAWRLERKNPKQWGRREFISENEDAFDNEENVDELAEKYLETLKSTSDRDDGI